MKKNLIVHQQCWHALCCLTALLACLPLLWPRMLPHSWRAVVPEYAGDVILASVLISFVVLGTASLSMLLRLRNLRTLGQLVLWALQWFLSCCIFALLAYFADVPAPPSPRASQADTQHESSPLPPMDLITGPSSLVIPIAANATAPSDICSAPHLAALEKHHPDLLRAYINKSPRWAASLSDQTFYTKPWHVVMILRDHEIGPGFVHAAFLRLTDGEQLPAGYVVVRSGDPLPLHGDSEDQVPDLALDLGGAHYLLLAWRGPGDFQRAFSALNAAILEVDEMVAPLAKKPDLPTLSRLINSFTDVPDEELELSAIPDILLSEPQAQSGCYQAQIVANPGEKGTYLLTIRDASSKETLLSLELPAHFSSNPKTILLHDIPGAIPAHLRRIVLSDAIPDKAPLFSIPCGERTAPFDALFELSFRPASRKTPHHVLTKLYRIAPFSNPNEHP